MIGLELRDPICHGNPVQKIETNRLVCETCANGFNLNSIPLIQLWKEIDDKLIIFEKFSHPNFDDMKFVSDHNKKSWG